MQTQKAIGEVFPVSIIRGSGGGIRSREKVNGCYCYVRQEGVAVEEGDLILARYIGQNKHGSMSLVEVVRFLDSADGSHHLLSQYELKFSLALRQAEQYLGSMRRQLAKYPDLFSAHLIEVATAPNSSVFPLALPTKYVRDQLSAGVIIRKSAYLADNPMHLPQLDKLADLELELGNIDAAKAVFEDILSIAQKSKHDRDDEFIGKASLGLARIAFDRGDLGTCTHHYRRANRRMVLENKDLRQLAEAYSQLGRNDLAYSLLARLTDRLASELAAAQTPMFIIDASLDPQELLGLDIPPAVTNILATIMGGISGDTIG